MASLTKLVSRLSPQLRASLENAVGEAMKRKSAAVENAHWLFHIIFGSDTELQSFLEDQGVSMSDLQAELEKAMPVGSGDGGKQPTISGSVAKLIEQAWLQASVEMDLGQITPEIFLLASQLPNALGARTEPLSALKPLSTDALRDFSVKRGATVPRAVSGGGGGAAPAGDGTALQKFTVNLTQQARDGELDKVLGRTGEVSKAIDVLLRKRQNNPILLGAPGVGKTAVVEGLAQKIASGEVPEQLQGADLVALDMGLLQAGASVKGEFEERLKNVIKEVQSSETPIIVFIDEAHTMIGAGGAEGQNDAANLLKPALARGEFRTVAATTFAEYKKYFEKDPALSRRFQPITIDEPGRDAAVNIVRTVAEGLSAHHDVFVREEAIKAAVDLSIRFMPSRRLPDKAISLMDTACARVALSQHARPAQIEALEEELRFVEAELAKSLADARMFGEPEFDASELNSSIEDLQTTVADRISMWEDQKEKVAHRLEAARAAMDADSDEATAVIPEADEEDGDAEIFVHPWVTQATIAEVVSDWTGVPVSNLGASEAERLLALEDTLKERVIGQDAAIEAIARSLKISRAGLTDARKPIGVFMMCGPSGVGKTETALAIADQFFGGEDAVVTINMTEFKEAHKVSMLLGAAAGYVGYGKGGVLTEAVRRRPYCVLLLDEMEKAHREIQDIFFQIFDKGHISDSEGNDVDFRNTIIIMTSNAGGEEIRDFIDAADDEPTSAELTDHLRPLLLDFFSPAFIGRTELIAYKPLTPEVGSKLTEIHLNRIKKRISAQYGASFAWEDSFVDYVVSANSDPLSGGRALEAIINKKFLPRLAEECISRVIDDKPLSSITVSHDGEDVVLSME
ncbi:type VI secretion system ATPase TssH [Cognatiyoonia sp. IB215446]|uniref:type VI secretion system ATPase TssH n=1 Tax=Cognatiyoonia sp. IB215446 TaxID=3097355 RepID=UPI002A0BFA05|nr:type VI secretion system ATPase TssH [Cognatiyoonia sp. IB215446]MDX8349806.1 type VI secretion system ATPase TssH [Cognatiyoonia sp. IB215446]